MQRSSIVVKNTDPGGPENLSVHIDEVPVPGASEVVIQTQYCALNYPDLLMTSGDYQLHPNVPFTLGSEALGKVIECGSEVSAVKVGDVVHALTWHGAFTTHLVVDAGPFAPREDAMRDVEAAVSPSTLLRAPLSIVPNDLPTDKVAAMGFVYSTAYYTLKDRGNLSKGQRILVLGASGGVGLAAVQIAIATGADVVAATRGDEGHSLCRRFGARTIESDYLLDDERRRLEFKDNKRFDVVFDLLGGKYTEPALKTLRPEGRFLVIGFVSEKEKGSTTVHTGLVLVKECTLIGSAWGAWASRNPSLHSANFDVLFSWLRDGTIDPFISRVIPLTEAAQALSLMQSGAVRGKVLLKA
ncbi:MAG TPA: NADPH:quinone oxidoreductase family protein [Pyrinomonadaceae bacterium]|nr:NADPH:quinone oxidoreductase family protein [Pyrinomonadaceae bacterium]